jgi:hypothetical protein
MAATHAWPPLAAAATAAAAAAGIAKADAVAAAAAKAAAVTSDIPSVAPPHTAAERPADLPALAALEARVAAAEKLLVAEVGPAGASTAGRGALLASADRLERQLKALQPDHIAHIAQRLSALSAAAERHQAAADAADAEKRIDGALAVVEVR